MEIVQELISDLEHQENNFSSPKLHHPLRELIGKSSGGKKGEKIRTNIIVSQLHGSEL